MPIVARTANGKGLRTRARALQLPHHAPRGPGSGAGSTASSGASTGNGPSSSGASLARALELGLDGVAYEVRASADGELVLARHATLERTTDGTGRVAERAWRELAELDAGGEFGARFRGERLALLEDALALPGTPERGAPQHVLLLEAAVDLGRVRDLVRELAPLASVRIGARDEGTLLEARDLGLAPMLVTERAGPRQREFVARERIAACAAPAWAWSELEREAWD